MSRVLYDLIIAFAFGHHMSEDSLNSQQLLEQAKDILTEEILPKLSSCKLEDAKLIFNNKMFERVFLSKDENQRSLVNDHGLKALAILQELKKAFAEKGNTWPDLTLSWKLDKNCPKVAKMWAIIKEGTNSKTLWHNIKMKKLLEDDEAREITEKWGKKYTSDKHLFDDTVFKTTVTTDENESKMIYIEKNSSLKTVKVTLKDGSVTTANAARLQVMQKNQVEVPKGSSADIEIVNSYPTVMFSGRFKFRLELSSTNWKPLLDSSVSDPKIVVGSESRVLFIGKDDRIFAMGKGLLGKDDEGWVREVEKPEECKDTEQVLYFGKFGLILTKEGKVFVNGEDINELLPLIDGHCSCSDDLECPLKGKESDCAKDRFKQVDLDVLFPNLLTDDKIIQVDVGMSKTKYGGDKEKLSFAAVTEQGNLLIASPDLFECCQDKTIANEAKKSFKLKVAERINGPPIKSKHVFINKTSISKDNPKMLVTAENKDGKMMTVELEKPKK